MVLHILANAKHAHIAEFVLRWDRDEERNAGMAERLGHVGVKELFVVRNFRLEGVVRVDSGR